MECLNLNLFLLHIAWPQRCWGQRRGFVYLRACVNAQRPCILHWASSTRRKGRGAWPSPTFPSSPILPQESPPFSLLNFSHLLPLSLPLSIMRELGPYLNRRRSLEFFAEGRGSRQRRTPFRRGCSRRPWLSSVHGGSPPRASWGRGLHSGLAS